jgi:hypothetical protein
MEKTIVVLPEEVLVKVEPGHQFYNDPPSGISAMRRWTCDNCGDAVLCSPSGNVYGSATENTCEQSQAFWEQYKARR